MVTRRRSPALQQTLLALPLLLVLSACQMPRFEGPQVQAPPANFIIVEDNYQRHRMFSDREIGFHTAWVHSDVSGVSVIYVNGHAGTTVLDDVIAAQEAARAAAADPDTHFSGIEVVTIDGRSGWGWSERIQSDRRGLVQVAYRAVVPYDTVSYAIEFVSGEPTLKIAAPDTLRVITASFAVGRTTWNLPLIAIGAGALLLLVGMLREKAKARQSRLRSINLVQVERKEDEDEDEDAQPPRSTTRQS